MRLLRAITGAVLVLALAGVAGCRRKPDPPFTPPQGSPFADRVRVLNADVFVIDGKHVRLAGAVTPQPVPDARCWAEALAAKQATAIVRAMIKDAIDVRFEPTGKTDAYNRAISHVFLDGQDLAAKLHDAGMAAEAEPDSRSFSWCRPISEGGVGAPDVKSLMDFSRG